MEESTNTAIQKLLESNKLNDLKGFLKKRSCLNTSNVVLMYLFHLIQTAGILTTTLAAGYDVKYIVFIGASLNALASLINVFHDMNESLSKQYAKDIQLIRDNQYLDEAPIDLESGSQSSGDQKQTK